jgi:putative hydrolase of the HAD superfamily
VAIRAITLDLDDTLWPFAPVARRIQATLAAWLAEHAPRTAARYDAAAAVALLVAVRDERPDLVHDLAETRREALRRMLASAGEDPALAEPAFAALNDARQQVEVYPDAAPALERLRCLGPLVAITNGNADLERIGLADCFDAVIASERVGVAKPDPRIFELALARLDLPAADVLHAGDDLHTDVGGALAAGLQAAWVHRDLTGDAPAAALRARDLLHLAELVGA